MAQNFNPYTVSAGGNAIGSFDYLSSVFYSRDLLENLKPSVYMLAYAKATSIPPNSGVRISWRRPQPFIPGWINYVNTHDIPEPTTGPAYRLIPVKADTDAAKLVTNAYVMTEGVRPAQGYFAVDEVTAIIAQLGNFRKYSDWVPRTAIDPITQMLVREQVPEAAMVLELVVQNKLSLATNVTYGGDATETDEIVAGDGLTTALLDAAALAMREAWVPKMTGFLDPNAGQATVPGRPAYVGFLTPVGVNFARGLTGWVNVESYRDGNNTLPNEVGMYGDIRFVEEPLGLYSYNNESSQARVEYTPIIGMDAFARTTLAAGGNFRAMLMPADVPRQGDELGQQGSIGWKAEFVATILEQARVQLIEWTAET